jgi:hypothetical protein
MATTQLTSPERRASMSFTHTVCVHSYICVLENTISSGGELDITEK